MISLGYGIARSPVTWYDQAALQRNGPVLGFRGREGITDVDTNDRTDSDTDDTRRGERDARMGWEGQPIVVVHANDSPRAIRGDPSLGSRGGDVDARPDRAAKCRAEMGYLGLQLEARTQAAKRE